MVVQKTSKAQCDSDGRDGQLRSDVFKELVVVLLEGRLLGQHLLAPV